MAVERVFAEKTAGSLAVGPHTEQQGFVWFTLIR
jgi:hypothetical protein